MAMTVMLLSGSNLQFFPLCLIVVIHWFCIVQDTYIKDKWWACCCFQHFHRCCLLCHFFFPHPCCFSLHTLLHSHHHFSQFWILLMHFPHNPTKHNNDPWQFQWEISNPLCLVTPNLLTWCHDNPSQQTWHHSHCWEYPVPPWHCHHWQLPIKVKGRVYCCLLLDDYCLWGRQKFA